MPRRLRPLSPLRLDRHVLARGVQQVSFLYPVALLLAVVEEEVAAVAEVLQQPEVVEGLCRIAIGSVLKPSLQVVEEVVIVVKLPLWIVSVGCSEGSKQQALWGFLVPFQTGACPCDTAACAHRGPNDCSGRESVVGQVHHSSSERIGPKWQEPIEESVGSVLEQVMMLMEELFFGEAAEELVWVQTVAPLAVGVALQHQQIPLL